MPTAAQEKRRLENEAYLRLPLVRAWLNTIAYAEGTGDNYNMIVGERQGKGSITDFSRHPDVMRRLNIRGKATPTSAAGRYQFIGTTYTGMGNATGLTDFSPHSQDVNAVEALRQNGALNALLSGNMQDLVARSGRTWAGIPGELSRKHNQPSRSEGDVLAAYGNFMRQAGMPAEQVARFVRPPVGTDPAVNAANLVRNQTPAPLRTPRTPASPGNPATLLDYSNSLRDFLNANTQATLDTQDLSDKLMQLAPQAQPAPTVFDDPQVALEALDSSKLAADAERVRADALNSMFGDGLLESTQLPTSIESAIGRILREETNG